MKLQSLNSNQNPNFGLNIRLKNINPESIRNLTSYQELCELQVRGKALLERIGDDFRFSYRKHGCSGSVKFPTKEGLSADFFLSGLNKEAILAEGQKGFWRNFVDKIKIFSTISFGIPKF